MLAHLTLCFNRLTHKYIYSNPLKPNIHFREVHYSKEQKTQKRYYNYDSGFNNTYR